MDRGSISQRGEPKYKGIFIEVCEGLRKESELSRMILPRLTPGERLSCNKGTTIALSGVDCSLIAWVRGSMAVQKTAPESTYA